MSNEIAARFDVSDVIQETHVETVRRIDDYLSRKPMSFRLWIRQTALETFLRLWRKHVDAGVRTITREEAWPDRTSLLLARQALDQWKTPSEEALDAETAQSVRDAITELPGSDREILVMRNYEGLSNQEVAEALQLSPEASRKRYTRALFKLREVLVRLGLCEADK